jgi:hypothetical protein
MKLEENAELLFEVIKLNSQGDENFTKGWFSSKKNIFQKFQAFTVEAQKMHAILLNSSH